jgi:hypothetical protein
MNGKKRENQWHNKYIYISNVLKMCIGKMIDEYEIRKIKHWVNIFLVLYPYVNALEFKICKKMWKVHSI